jgi:hypothetical protein
MSSKKDPRKFRTNPELKFIEKVMFDSWRQFRSADNYSEKRGSAMILQAHLEEWLDQPETFCDLENGVSTETNVPYRTKDVPLDAELVFYRGGPADNLFFFYAGGTISQLFTKAELYADPEKVRRYGYYVVTIYEKMWATENATESHFTSEEAIRRHIPSSSLTRWSQKNDFDVLADPQGCPDPKKCQIVSRYRSLKKAISKAENSAQEFGIRFVVGRVHGLVDNH